MITRHARIAIVARRRDHDDDAICDVINDNARDEFNQFDDITSHVHDVMITQRDIVHNDDARLTYAHDMCVHIDDDHELCVIAFDVSRRDDKHDASCIDNIDVATSHIVNDVATRLRDTLYTRHNVVSTIITHHYE